jgi:hypothetical protein
MKIVKTWMAEGSYLLMWALNRVWSLVYFSEALYLAEVKVSVCEQENLHTYVSNGIEARTL